ncbi:MAG TPA: bifunctional phosphopantothenoylcysteine decarboxylase/phosphopantothenate--cysteine ligase CoaBC [Gemmatimonadales bacterium]|nr:bifunctional phosphopantothenoylcysteine decarboxylase/phosphopantothenate--cysteine ligase CoaBC [Gemmatimonadales bacterium]
MWAGRHVVLGVSGGIACYKSCILARRLVDAGARVDAVLTEGAAEFVRPLTFEALTGRPVLSSLWESRGALSHVRLGHEADIIIVAPATAHLIARLAQGLADDVLTALLLARTAPLLLAPSMNDEMFANPATGANIEVLRRRGVALVGPETGPLAEGPSDRPGRMSEPETILAHAARLLRGAGLAGRRVVVTAGPTREPIDPVRVVSNRSSGKMGYRVAEAAWERGADVVLISGPTALPPPIGVALRLIDSTRDLEAAVRAELPAADVLVMAAAPADYRPSSPSDSKRSRVEGALAIPMEPTEDILGSTRENRKDGSVMVGFALETGDALAKGLAKLERKDLDLIVVNDAMEPGAGFEKETNRVALLGRDGSRKILPLQSKREVAEAILDIVEEILGGGNQPRGR